MEGLHGIRRRPTLPGRFQPSTISVLRLNFCVRDGNRWIPQAIVTGNSGLSVLSGFSPFRTLKTAQARALFGLTMTSLHPSETLPFALASSRPLRRPSLSASHKSSGSGFSFGIPGFRSLPPPTSRLASTFPSPFCLLPIPSSLRSSPRPISIIKLHTLLRFHR